MENSSPFDKLGSTDLLPGGVPSAITSAESSPIVGGKAGRCWDQAGKVYLDFICGYGPLILGHNHMVVNEAVIDQLHQGMLFPSNSPLHEKLRVRLRQFYPSADKTLVFKTGSEAIAAAIRLARAFTGKLGLIRCGFHGWHDTMISPFTSWHLYEADPQPPRLIEGVPLLPKPPVLPWNGEDLQELTDLCARYSEEVAALIIDPIQLREPLAENLQQLRMLTRKHNMLLILDEIKTGFRVSLGGVQHLYGIEADLTVLSKAIANGFPLAVVLGRDEILSLTASIKIMGTYNNELLSVAAALATLSVLEKPEVIPWLWEIGQRLIDGFNGILQRRKLLEHVCALPYRWPCLPALWYRQQSNLARHLQIVLPRELTRRGLLLLANHPFYTCAEHTSMDITEALQIFAESVEACLLSGTP